MRESRSRRVLGYLNYWRQQAFSLFVALDLVSRTSVWLRTVYGLKLGLLTYLPFFSVFGGVMIWGFCEEHGLL